MHIDTKKADSEWSPLFYLIYQQLMVLSVMLTISAFTILGIVGVIDLRLHDRLCGSCVMIYLYMTSRCCGACPEVGVIVMSAPEAETGNRGSAQ